MNNLEKKLVQYEALSQYQVKCFQSGVDTNSTHHQTQCTALIKPTVHTAKKYSCLALITYTGKGWASSVKAN